MKKSLFYFLATILAFSVVMSGCSLLEKDTDEATDAEEEVLKDTTATEVTLQIIEAPEDEDGVEKDEAQAEVSVVVSD
ncbi:hypothetical protein ACFL21_04100 [Patescibacteria group bacterium]